MLVIGRIPLHPAYITSVDGEKRKLDSRGGNPTPFSDRFLHGVSVSSFALGHPLNLTSLCCPLPFVEIVTYKKMLLHLHIV
jgi:hypothetical protein